MIHYVKGNLLDSNCNYICHQVNCQGVMGSGIAKQIRERWPEVYKQYRDHYGYVDAVHYGNLIDYLLGSTDVVELCDGSGRHVINMYSQLKCGYDGKRYTSYGAFEEALSQIKKRVPAGSKIGFPKNIGCGLGGGNWKVISAMIEAELGDDYEVYIYEYEPKED